MDKNNAPNRTIFYLAAVSYRCLKEKDYIGLVELYKRVKKKMCVTDIPFNFFTLAIDFLFLNGKVSVNKRGDLYVPEQNELSYRKAVRKNNK